MKIPKPRTDYLLTLYFPTLLAGMLIAIFLGKYFLLITNAIMLTLLITALLLAISPLGKRTLPQLTTPAAQKPWPIQLITLQISLYLLFTLIFQNNTIEPVATPTNWVLYTSWPLCLLLAPAFAHFAKTKKSAPIIDASLRPVFGDKLDSVFGSGIDIFIKQALFFSCALVISTAILLITQIFRQWLHLPDLYQPQFNHLPLTTLIILVFSMPFWRHYVHLAWRRNMSLPWLLCFFSLILLSVILGFHLMIALFNFLLPNLQPTAPVIEITIQQFFVQILPSPLHWQLLTFAWWIGLTPLIALTIAHIMQGKSLRVTIFSTLIIPIAMIFVNHLPINHGEWVWQLVLSFFSLTAISFIFKDQLLTTLIMSAGTGKNAGRVALTSVQSLLFFIAIVTVIYLLTGINLITLLFFSFTAATFWFLVMIALSYIKNFIRL